MATSHPIQHRTFLISFCSAAGLWKLCNHDDPAVIVKLQQFVKKKFKEADINKDQKLVFDEFFTIFDDMCQAGYVQPEKGSAACAGRSRSP